MQAHIGIILAALLALVPRTPAAEHAAAPACSSSSRQGACAARNQGGAVATTVATPGLVLLQDRYVASIDVAGRHLSLAASCAPFSEWPDVDNGVTCGDCTALVSTSPHNTCDAYCRSFGHTCLAAFEEEGDTCAVKHNAACSQPFFGTSDMLCKCHKSPGSGPRPVRPPQYPRVCGAARGCDYCDASESPMHAGCFVLRGDGRLLAIRLTYDGRKFDLPGGQTNWREPPRCTAHRETYEESGFEVTPTELLDGNLHGGYFRLYRCVLLKERPSKRPDHEVSQLAWLSKDEVRDKLRRGLWRFPEASRYVDWMR